MASQHLAQAEDAISFFGGISHEDVHAELLTTVALPAGAPTGAPEKYTGTSGLFSFVFSDKQLSTDPSVQSQVEQAKYYLKGFMSLVTAKLFNNHAGDMQAAFTIPPSTLKDIATHLPLISSFSSSHLANHKQTTAAEFSTDFLKLALNLSIGNDVGALKNVTDWLGTLGKQITVSASSTKNTYNVTVFSGMIEVTGVGSVINVEPQFCISGASLSVTDIKAAVSGCANARAFSLNFEADNFRAGLNMDALQDPAVKAKVDALVTAGIVQTIDDSKNYFGG